MPTQIIHLLLRNLDLESADVGCGIDCRAHDGSFQRSDSKAARNSFAKISGSSQAAKWPPLSTSLK